MDKKNFSITENKKYGFKHLFPIPTQEELNNFYESQYYKLTNKGGRAPEIRRLDKGGQEGERELSWLQKNMYTDICHILGEITPGKYVLDAGCGRGDFVSFMIKQGYNAAGFDPSADAIATAQQAGLPCQQATLEGFAGSYDLNVKGAFDAATLINVLEHVPDPVQTVLTTRMLLKGGGVICIRVPNDYTEIQEMAQKKIAKDPWWVAIPDHINYFNIHTLGNLLTKTGFEVQHTQTEFPMEFFLLMGDDYVGNPEIGEQCHLKRMSFEMAIHPEFRRKLYKTFAELGIGRGVIMFAKKVD